MFTKIIKITDSYQNPLDGTAISEGSFKINKGRELWPENGKRAKSRPYPYFWSTKPFRPFYPFLDRASFLLLVYNEPLKFQLNLCNIREIICELL